ncbi:MAG: hypothetical protein K0R57_3692 [Paenibacillaceae bacterium]|nr:hypothetical protein [Paenibacillaceae bacterium]
MHIENLLKFESRVIRTNITKYIEELKEKKISDAYFEKKVQKKKQGTRTLQCIESDHILYKIQRQLKNNFFDYIPLSNHAYGYVKGKSYFDYLAIHKNKKFYLRLDIKDFFSNIKEKKLRNTLAYYINDIEVNPELKLIDFVLNVVTLNGQLPQGAVTSPVLSNIFFRPLDIRISRYCKKFGIEYSRYVDDLLFSSDSLFIQKRNFFNGICKILKSNGFSINPQKVIKVKNQISLNGFVIGNDIRLSRKKTARLSAIIYCYQRSKGKNISDLISTMKEHFKMGEKEKVNLPWLHNYLAGYRSFLLSMLPFDSAGVLPELISEGNNKILFKINQIEKILDIIPVEI